MDALRSPTPERLRAVLARATAAAPTYAQIGAADSATPPAAHRVIAKDTVIGTGRAVWERVGDALLRLDLHREAGMVVLATDEPARPGTTVVSAAPYGPLWFAIPCRVSAVIDEPDRRGFLYGTLPGNPVRGEERFTVEHAPDGRVIFRLRSFSRLAGLPAVVPPAGRGAQWLVNRRYLAAARRLACVS